MAERPEHRDDVLRAARTDPPSPRRPSQRRSRTLRRRDMSTPPAVPGVFALLADGAIAEIRAAAPDDADAVRSMYEAMSPENLYLRFFNLSKSAIEAEV